MKCLRCLIFEQNSERREIGCRLSFPSSSGEAKGLGSVRGQGHVSGKLRKANDQKISNSTISQHLVKIKAVFQLWKFIIPTSDPCGEVCACH